MKPGLPASIIFCCLCLSQANIYSDETLISLESMVLETFDTPSTGEDATARWIVRGSSFIDKELGYPMIKSVKGWPEALYGRNRDNLDLRCLGIKAGFTRQAYNYLEIVPARQFDSSKDKDTDVFHTDAEGKKWVHAPIIFPGRIKAFSLWCWSSNVNYYLEAHFKDHSGVVHVLNLGDLNFTGWKNLNTEIPASIPQSWTHIPKTKKLRLEKLMLWTRPTERVAEFWCYLDQIKVLTDLFEARFDGDEFAEEKFLQETWGTPAK